MTTWALLNTTLACLIILAIIWIIISRLIALKKCEEYDIVDVISHMDKIQDGLIGGTLLAGLVLVFSVAIEGLLRIF